MFNRRKKQQRIIELISMIKPTSKASLKQTCLMLSNLDVDKAERMYDFLVKDMEEIPAVEPVPKTFIQNIGQQASDIMGWLRENQDMLSQGYELLKGIATRRRGIPPTTPLPPING